MVALGIPDFFRGRYGYCYLESLHMGSRVMDWSKYANFSAHEFACDHTRQVKMREDFIERLQSLRGNYGLPMVVTSGYRDASHPLEADKETPGVHTMGIAADFAVGGRAAYMLVKLATNFGFTGIGISQRSGQPRFIHLDIWDEYPRPNIWTY